MARKLRSYQAITTQYFGPGNVRGSRIKATAAAGSVTIGYDDSLNSEQNHANAAKALADKFGWPGSYYMGGLPNRSGYCFVCADEETKAFERFLTDNVA